MNIVLVLACMAIISSVAAGAEPVRFDLQGLLHSGGLTIVNRHVQPYADSSRTGLTLSEDFGEGIVWLNGVSFASGTIEIDLKGQDVYQRSFVGVAFRGANDSTFDAVYFRPFHFLSTDSVRMGRCVQYISLPDFPWRRLREEHPGVFENTVHPVPDPADWFHARIVVHHDIVSFYVNDADTPSLRAQILGGRTRGMVGVYTADRSGGSFGNLTIVPE